MISNQDGKENIHRNFDYRQQQEINQENKINKL